MKFNRYVFEVQAKNRIYLYNSINGMVCTLEKGNHNDEIEECSEIEKNFLEENYFLEECFGEKVSDIVRQIRNKLKYSQRHASFTIHLTYNCNMKCSYCYQNDVKRNLILSKENEEELYRFLIAIKNANDLIKIDVTFIGGEPVMFSDMMLRMRGKIDEIFNEIEVEYFLITNGTLLTKNIALEIGKCKWNNIQVTVDGSREIHDKFRMYMNNKGTFDDIVANIIVCQELLLPVVINCNISKYTYKYVEDLLRYLKLHNIQVPVYFSYVFECEGDASKSNSKDDFEQSIWYEVHHIAIKYGYKYEPFYRLAYMLCGSSKVNDYVISPEGDLYKCISGVGNKKFYVGHMRDYNTWPYIHRLAQFIELDNMSGKCYNCKYEVVCGGWCSYKKMVYGDYCAYKELQNNDLRMLEDFLLWEQD